MTYRATDEDLPEVFWPGCKAPEPVLFDAAKRAQMAVDRHDKPLEEKRKEVKKVSKQFRGRTEDADSIFLGAEFWKAGVKIAGAVVRTFESENGPCYVLDLVNAVTVNGELADRVSIGNLTGFRMALQAAGLERLQVGDQIHLECTGAKPTSKGSPRANFAIEVTRP